MKNQALFSLKDKNKKLKCLLLQFLFGALRVNLPAYLSQCKAQGWYHILLELVIWVKYCPIIALTHIWLRGHCFTKNKRKEKLL